MTFYDRPVEALRPVPPKTTRSRLTKPGALVAGHRLALAVGGVAGFVLAVVLDVLT